MISLTAAPPGTPYKHRQIFKNLPILHRSRILRLMVLPLLLNFVGLRNYDVVHFNGDDWFFVFRNVATVRTFYGSALWEARSATRLRRKLSLYIVYPLEHLAARLATVTLGLGAEASLIYHTDGIARPNVLSSRFYPGPKSAEPSFVFIGLWAGRKRGWFVADQFLNKILPTLPNAKLYMACDFVPEAAAICDLRNPTDQRLGEIIRSSWALLSASTYEGFGLPYLEALASGTVVVTTANSGANYVLEAGTCGLIVDDSAFAETVVDLARNVFVQNQYEAAGLARAAAFSAESVSDDYLAMYDLAIRKFQKKSDGN